MKAYFDPYQHVWQEWLAVAELNFNAMNEIGQTIADDLQRNFYVRAISRGPGAEKFKGLVEYFHHNQSNLVEVIQRIGSEIERWMHEDHLEEIINGHDEEEVKLVKEVTKKNVKCYKCHRLGHMAYQCRSKRMKYKDYNEEYNNNKKNKVDYKKRVNSHGKYCSYCKMRGHSLEECYKKNKDNIRHTKVESTNMNANTSVNKNPGSLEELRKLNGLKGKK